MQPEDQDEKIGCAWLAKVDDHMSDDSDVDKVAYPARSSTADLDTVKEEETPYPAPETEGWLMDFTRARCSQKS